MYSVGLLAAQSLERAPRGLHSRLQVTVGFLPEAYELGIRFGSARRVPGLLQRLPEPQIRERYVW